MRMKLTYPAKASFNLAEHWPLRFDDLEIQFAVDDSRIKAIVCIWPLAADDHANDGFSNMLYIEAPAAAILGGPVAI
jgi:hypothetical protein